MTSSGEQDQRTPNFKLEQIRDLLEKDSSDYLRGADDKNLGWILRDSSIAGRLPVEENNNKDDQIIESTNQLSPVSSHLTTSISNSNDAVSNKTRATISPIQEEIASPSKSLTDLATTSLTNNRRRSSVSSVGSTGTSSSGGFLTKLKGKLSHKFTEPSSPSSSTGVNHNVFKDNYSMNSSTPTQRKRSNTITPSKSVDSNSIGYELKKTISTPTYSDSLSDPRLDEYIKFYRRSSDRPSRRNSCINNLLEKNNSKADSTISQKFSFLKRRSSIQMGTQQERNMSSSDTVDTNRESEVDVPEDCKSLKPLRRVGFHSQTFLIDPPQQIPSRNPRKGNVEIGPDGELIIKALSDDDKKAIEKSQHGLGGGLVVGGSGTLGLIKPSDSTNDSSNEENDNDVKISKHAQSVAIDKPMFTHERHNYKLPVERMALDIMYTRCCHLREILPIPAIVKQIPKGSVAPLPILQMRNPTPTTIEVETFADFIRIAPILCVALDGVSLSIDQFKSILAAISSKTQLQKLSLRNCPIDSDGWSLLCLLLSQNKSIEKLDITQCPSLAVDVSKRKKKMKTKEEEVIRMTCNKENRSDMNWTLFTATVIARGGLEELILTGCCINDLEIFEKLIKRAVSIKTNRLGLAYNNLSVKQLKIIVENWLFKKFVRGLDLGYNDFSSVKFLNIWLEVKNKPGFEELISNSALTFLSLNATNLRFSSSFTDFFESLLLELPSLKYLDLSNNCRLFGTKHKLPSSPTKNETDDSSEGSSEASSNLTKENNMSEESIISYFTMKLPLFRKLIRLHFENNNFSNSSLISIANTLPYCKNLVYFSLIGNEMQLNAATALIQGLKNSKSLITLDCNFDNFPNLFKERVGLYGMRNLERQYLNKTKDPSEIGDSDSSKLSLTEQLNSILIKKAEKTLDLNSPEVTNIVNKASKIRSELTQTVNELLKLQLKNELNLEGKETLIRFLYINASIAKGLQLIDSSLVSQDANYSSSVLLHMSHENEAKQQGIKDNSVEYGVNTELSNISTIHAPTPTPLSRSASKTCLSERQEGSVLKLSKLHGFHLPDNEPFKGMSGEKIRDKLLNTNFRDLDNTIDYLVELKKKGVSMGRIFNMNSQSDYLSKLEMNLAQEIQERLNELSNLNIDKDKDKVDTTLKQNPENDKNGNDNDKGTANNNNENSSQQKKKESDLHENKQSSENASKYSENGELINQLYDEVLTTLPYLQK